MAVVCAPTCLTDSCACLKPKPGTIKYARAHYRLQCKQKRPLPLETIHKACAVTPRGKRGSHSLTRAARCFAAGFITFRCVVGSCCIKSKAKASSTNCRCYTTSPPPLRLRFAIFLSTHTLLLI